MPNTNFNVKKKEKPRRPKSAPLSARFSRRGAAAILAAFIALAIAFFSGAPEKLFGGRSPARPPKEMPASAATYRVTEVPDGDTVVLRASSGKELRVRLYGVDAPELRQSGGEAAAKFAGSLLRPGRVSLRVMDEDRYGRTVALLFLEDGRTLNEELVKAGHAWVYRAHCHEEPLCSNWYKHEYLAQKEGRGLWRGDDPLPPWKWREQNPRK